VARAALPVALLTVQEVAALLRTSPRTVRRWANEGRLRAVRIGRSIRFRADDLAHLIPKVSKEGPSR
jgi:excisionase family DNA binding protein